MSVQIIVKEGEPEYAVLPWADYQQLLQAAGRPQAEPIAPQAAPAATATVPLSAIAQLREQSNRTVADLAREVGISPHYMQMIEQGEREPSAVILRSLSRLLNVDQWQT